MWWVPGRYPDTYVNNHFGHCTNIAGKRFIIGLAKVHRRERARTEKSDAIFRSPSSLLHPAHLLCARGTVPHREGADHCQEGQIHASHGAICEWFASHDHEACCQFEYYPEYARDTVVMFH